MNPLPFENLTYESPLSEDELRQRISQFIEPKKIRFSRNKDTKPYEGYIDNNTFVINRIIQNRNSFLPQIKGAFEDQINGTRIHVKMSVHLSIYVFLGIWCLGVFAALLVFIYQAFQENQWKFEILFPLGMLLFAYLLTTIGFKSESSKSKKDLINILDGKIVPNSL